MLVFSRNEPMKGSPLDVGAADDLTSRQDWQGTERYEVRRRIGTGGMGVVYEALDRERGMLVAIKTLLRFSPSALYRFKQEFRTLSDVTHPNLVQLYELVATDTDHVFFAMELVSGVDFLSHALRPDAVPRWINGRPPTTKPSITGPSSDADRTGPFNPASATETSRPVVRSPADFDRLRPALAQLVAGVSALHEAGKLHRDIKPSNVLVTPEGRVVLLDFGVAMDLSLVVRRNRAEREVVGTARYMAPEQATETAPTVASDWYSVGAILYEALVGRPVFSGPSREVLLRKTLVDAPIPSELVADVPADLDALCSALLRRSPDTRPTGPEIARLLGDRPRVTPIPSVRAARTPRLIGRDAELVALSGAFDAARLGRMVTVRVHGSPGVGKAALVQQFVEERVARGEATALWGRAYERESMPYKALDSVVDALSRDLMQQSERDPAMTLPRDIDALAHLFPVLRRVERVGEIKGGGLSGSETITRRRAIVALQELLAGLAAKKPLILCVSDAQWGDVDSAGLLLDLVRPPFEAPILLVLSYREEDAESSSFLVETRTRWPFGAEVRDIAVGPLAHGDARALAMSFLVVTRAGALETAESIARESGGSPLLVEELARSVGRPIATAAGSPPGTSLAALTAVSLEKVVAERMSVLPDAARRLLELVAVCARPLPVSIVGDAAGVYEALHEMVGVLRVHRFVRTGLRDGREVVEMAQDRIRETIVAGLPGDTLRAYHGRLARVLEPFPGADAEALAVHLFGAGEKERAAKYAEQAAEQAAGKLAFGQAVRLYERAIETVGDGPPDALRLRVRLARVLGRARRGAQAAAVYMAAAQRTHGMKRMELERDAAEQLLVCGHVDEGVATLRGLLRAAGLRAPRNLFDAVVTFLACRLALALVGSRFRAREARDVRRVDHLRIEALYAVIIGIGLVNVFYGVCLQARHLLLALRAGDRFQVLRAAGIEALDAAALGGPERTRERVFAALARQLAEAAGDGDSLAFHEGTSTMRLFLHGHWKATADHSERLENTYTTTPAGWHANVQLFYLYALMSLGRLRDLRTHHAVRLAEAEERGDLYTTVNLRIGHSNAVWLVEDDVASARRHVREAMASWSQVGFSSQHYRALLAEANIELYAGAGERSYERVARDWRLLRRSLLFLVQYLRADATFLRARCALASLGSLGPRERRGRIAEVVRLARKLDGERMAWTAPLAALVWAGVAVARGDRPEAVGRLRVAVSSAQGADMLLYAAVARLRLGEMLGDDEGSALAGEARAWMTGQGVRSPDRFAAMLAPLPPL
jgi:serine/threonine protein kinase